MARRVRKRVVESSCEGSRPCKTPRTVLRVEHQCLACSKARGEKVFYPCRQGDVSKCNREKKAPSCRRQHGPECVTTKEKVAQKAQENERAIVQGHVSRCAVCQAKGKLRNLDEAIKAKWASPNVCEDCASFFEAVGPNGCRIKVCSGKSCLCASGNIGTNKCPIKSHRGESSDRLFARKTDSSKEWSRCRRCRKDQLAGKKKLQSRKEDDLRVYTPEEVHHFCSRTSLPKDAMPALDPEAATRPTYLSEVLFPDALVRAHVWLRTREKKAGMAFPTSHGRMNAHWNYTALEFTQVFPLSPRKATKEQTNPIRLGFRVLRSLSKQVNSTSNFADIDKPTLEEWVRVLSRESFFQNTMRPRYETYYPAIGIQFPRTDVQDAAE
jgi:hypothetical protein